MQIAAWIIAICLVCLAADTRTGQELLVLIGFLIGLAFWLAVFGACILGVVWVFSS